MDLKSKKIDSVIVLELDGNILGGPESVEINKNLIKFIEEGSKRFIIDLSNVNVMNSSGLGTLIASLTVIKKNGGELKIAGANSKIQNLFTVTKLNTIFELSESSQIALQLFQES
jgi:anti-anti-sigma factor